MLTQALAFLCHIVYRFATHVKKLLSCDYSGAKYGRFSCTKHVLINSFVVFIHFVLQRFFKLDDEAKIQFENGINGDDNKIISSDITVSEIMHGIFQTLRFCN